MLRLIQFKHNEFGFVREPNLTKPIEIGIFRETLFSAKEDAADAAIAGGYWWDQEEEVAREH